MTKLETLQLKLTATRVRMGVIEATHGMRKADQMMNTDYSILPLHCCQGWDFSINSCVGGQSCRKSTSQFNLSGMDRY